MRRDPTVLDAHHATAHSPATGGAHGAPPTPRSGGLRFSSNAVSPATAVLIGTPRGGISASAVARSVSQDRSALGLSPRSPSNGRASPAPARSAAGVASPGPQQGPRATASPAPNGKAPSYGSSAQAMQRLRRLSGQARQQVTSLRRPPIDPEAPGWVPPERDAAYLPDGSVVKLPAARPNISAAMQFTGQHHGSPRSAR